MITENLGKEREREMLCVLRNDQGLIDLHSAARYQNLFLSFECAYFVYFSILFNVPIYVVTHSLLCVYNSGDYGLALMVC